MDVVNRTFVGIRMPEPISQNLEQAVTLLKRKPGVGEVRWNTPQELLLVLCSLGERGVEVMPRLREVLRAACAGTGPLMLTVEGFGGIPNALQPRYVFAGVTGDVERLTILTDSLWRAADSVLGPREGAKPFHPHIVLGRLKTESEPLRVSLGRALRTVDKPVMGTMQVNVVDLLFSNAGPGGVGYTVVEELPLG